MWNTSLASVSPGTAKKKQASMEESREQGRAVNQTASKGRQGYTVTPEAAREQPAHLETWEGLTDSKRTILIAVDYEHTLISLL